MTCTSVAIAIATLGFLLFLRLQGEAVPAPKKLFVLPVIVGAIGLENISRAKPNAIALGVIVTGSALSLGLGALRGRFDRLSVVNGAPYMAWTAGSVVILVVNVLLKLALDAGGVAARGTKTALTDSILLSLGLTLLGEAAVIWVRAQSLTSGGAPEARYRGPAQQAERPTQWPPIR
jgi:hypothetical protein